MTDKEIIIDGVDVAGCKYLNKVVNEEPYCNIDEEHLYTCSSDENCYYKQLKRLEFENAEIKAENEKLKEKFIQVSEDLGNATVKNFTLENKLDDTESRLITLQKANTHNLVLLQRCKTCLQEIKVIAEDLLEKGLEPQSVEHQLRLRGKRELASIIIDLITKAESEG